MKKLICILLGITLMSSSVYAIDDWTSHGNGYSSSGTYGLMLLDIRDYFMHDTADGLSASFWPTDVKFDGEAFSQDPTKTYLKIQLVGVGNNWDNHDWCRDQTNELYHFLKKRNYIKEFTGVQVYFVNKSGFESRWIGYLLFHWPTYNESYEDMDDAWSCVIEDPDYKRDRLEARAEAAQKFAREADEYHKRYK